MVNGTDLKSLLKSRTMMGGVQPAEAFGEMQFRQLLQGVERLVKQQGGGAPIVDPMALLSLGLVLDKLNDISERVAKIEQVMSVPQDVAEGLSG